MEEKRKFERYGINAPGRVNLKLDGRFKEVRLDDLPDDKLEQLYNSGCPYVKPTAYGLSLMRPGTVIKNKEIAIQPAAEKPAKETAEIPQADKKEKPARDNSFKNSKKNPRKMI